METKKTKKELVSELVKKNTIADKQARKQNIKKLLKTAKPYVIVIGWYVFILYLFTAYINANYSFKTFLFAFSLFFVYEKIYDDYVDIIKFKHNNKGE